MLLRGRTRTATITVSGSLLAPGGTYNGLGSRAVVGSEWPWSYALTAPDPVAAFNNCIEAAWMIGDIIPPGNPNVGKRECKLAFFFGPGSGDYRSFYMNPATIGAGPYAISGTISFTLQEWFELTDTGWRCYEAIKDGTVVSYNLKLFTGAAYEQFASGTSTVNSYDSGFYQDGTGVLSRWRWGNYLARCLYQGSYTLGQQSLSASIAYSSGGGSSSPYAYHKVATFRKNNNLVPDAWRATYDASAGALTTKLEMLTGTGTVDYPALPYYIHFGMVDLDNGGYNAKGEVFADKDPYPDPLTLYAQQTDFKGNFNTGAVTANPSFTDSSVRDGHLYWAAWYVEPDAGGAAQRAFLDTGFQYPITRIGYAVSRNSLGANGEEPLEQRTSSDYRLNLYWKKWDALLPAQLTSVTVDDGSATTLWSASAGCTRSVAGGAIRLDVPAATAGPRLQKSYALGSEFNMHSYRFLEVRYRVIGHDNHPVRITVAERTTPLSQQGQYRKWAETGDLDGVWKTLTLDLCGPPEWGSADSSGATLTPIAIPAKDETWSRHPLIITGGPMFGNGLCPWIRFDLDTYSGALALEVDYIKLKRVQTPKISVFHPGYGEQVLVRPTTGSLAAVYWPVRVTTDGKSAVDMAFDDGRTTVYTIGQLASQWIGQPYGLGSDNPGWTVGLGAGPDAFHTSARRSTWLGGGGVLYDQGTDSFTPFIDDQTEKLPAQSWWSSMDFYPGCGDALGIAGGAYGGPLEVRAAISFRSAIEGLLFDLDGNPNVGIPVTTLDTVVSRDAGSGTSDSIGYYKTALPYGRGHRATQKTQTQPHSTGLLPMSALAWSNWGRQRCSFRVPKVESLAFVQPWNLEHESGQYHAAAVHVDNGIVYWRSDFAVPLPWALTGNLRVVTSDDTDANPRIAIDYRQRVYVVWERGGPPATNSYWAYSDDDGATWGGEAVAIAGGTHPTIATAPDGTVILAAYVTGTIEVRRRFAGDAAYSAAAVIKDDAGADIAAEDEQFHLSYAYEGPARWLLHMRVDGETATSHWESADDGLTWTRVL